MKHIIILLAILLMIGCATAIETAVIYHAWTYEQDAEDMASVVQEYPHVVDIILEAEDK